MATLVERVAALQASFAQFELATAAAHAGVMETESEVAAAGADELLQELAERRAAAAEAQDNCAASRHCWRIQRAAGWQ